MFTDIFLVVMLETAETTGVKQDKNNHNLSITHTVGFVTMIGLLILNHIFFLLKCKFLAKIIGHTINLCNFNTFIAMFLIISEIYLFLYRTHVKYKKNGKLACKIELAESTKIVKRAIILTENYANESS